MFRRTGFGLFICITLVLFYCNLSFAVGAAGFRNEVPDAEAMGKGSAFVAQADNPSAVYFNPAGLTQLDGEHVSISCAAEFPMAEVETDNDGTVNMQREYFLIPSLYFVSALNSENLRFGLGLTAPYGLSSDWAQDSFASRVSAESELGYYNLAPTLAYKVNDYLSIGGGIDYFYSKIIKHKRLSAALSSNGNFQLKGNDEGWGYNIGVLLQPSPKHSIGLSYRSEIDFSYTGKLSLDNIDQGLYPVIFGGASYSTDVKTELTLPRSLALGYAYRPNDKWTFEIDFEWTDWASVEQDRVEFLTETDATRLAVLNSGNPAAKDWNDVGAIGLGVEYKVTDNMALRTGYIFENSPVPSANFDTALPDADRHALTLGFGYDLRDNIKLDFSYMALFFRERDVTNDVGLIVGTDIDGKYKQIIHIYSLGITYSY